MAALDQLRADMKQVALYTRRRTGENLGRQRKMDAAELRQMQAPIKERYKTDPKAALITLKAKG
jgi:hypothetical protein